MHRGGRTVYGHSVGILLLNTKFPRIPGDIGNATTFPYPVLYHVVGSVTLQKVMTGDLSVVKDFVQGARTLEKQGVKAITTSCGFLALHHESIAAAVGIPVFASSLIQVPLVSRLTGGRPVGILTGDASRLGEAHFRGVGWSSEEIPVVVKGLEDCTHFSSSILADGDVLDSQGVCSEMVRSARSLLKQHPEIGAFVLECSNMPPYANHIRQATGVPVFDLVTLTNWVHSAVVQEDPCASLSR